MSDLFISYVQEDSEVAEELAGALERAGYTTWYYERDALPGTSWLTQVGKQIGSARAVVLLISARSLESPQVTTEIDWVREQRKPLVPVLVGIGHEDIRKHQEQWAVALGSVVAIAIPADGLTDRFLGRLVGGLSNLGVEPGQVPPAEPDHLEERLAEVRRLLRDRTGLPEAERTLQTLMAQHPQAARVHRYLGQLYNRSFRAADAVAAFERAVGLEPGNALLHWELALAYQGHGRLRDAAGSLRRAVELGLDPERESRARTLLDRLGGVGG